MQAPAWLTLVSAWLMQTSAWLAQARVDPSVALGPPPCKLGSLGTPSPCRPRGAGSPAQCSQFSGMPSPVHPPPSAAEAFRGAPAPAQRSPSSPWWPVTKKRRSDPKKSWVGRSPSLGWPGGGLGEGGPVPWGRWGRDGGGPVPRCPSPWLRATLTAPRRSALSPGRPAEPGGRDRRLLPAGRPPPCPRHPPAQSGRWRGDGGTGPDPEPGLAGGCCGVGSWGVGGRAAPWAVGGLLGL